MAIDKKISKKDIEESLSKIINQSISDFFPNKIDDYKKSDKGNIGKLMEEWITGDKVTNKSAPDIENSEETIEIKTIGMKYNKQDGKKKNINQLVAKERLVLGNINFDKIVEEKTFLESHIYKKVRNMLIVKYLYEENKKFYDWKILGFDYLNFSDELLKILEKDYVILRQKILDGKAHEISESDTKLLKACTKGQTSKDHKKQPFSDIAAKPRAYSINSKSFTKILNNRYETEDKSLLFKYIKKHISKHFGRNIQEMINQFGFDYSTKFKSKKDWCIKKILNIQNYFELDEFIDSYSIIRNIEIKNNKKSKCIKEEILLSKLDETDYFSEKLENYQESSFINLVKNYNLILIVWETKDSQTYLKDIIDYKFTEQDIKDAEFVYNDTANKIMEGKVIKELIKANTKSGIKYKLNFISRRKDKTFHIRPRGKDGTDTITSETGETFPKQFYWLNKNKIERILKLK